MKDLRGKLLLVLLLLGLSAGLFFVHYLIFGRFGEALYYIVFNIAFMPLEALLVTFIIQELLEYRERRSRREKLNMVIGVFFSEAGTALLSRFSPADPRIDGVRSLLLVDKGWTEEQFLATARTLRDYPYGVEADKIDFPALRDFLVAKREFLVRLMENPALLEHEAFSGLLMAVFHLTEELAARKAPGSFSAADREHLAGDVQRVYVLLAQQWLSYMKHLFYAYPFLFSLAARTNPFDRCSAVELR